MSMKDLQVIRKEIFPGVHIWTLPDRLRNILGRLLYALGDTREHPASLDYYRREDEMNNDWLVKEFLPEVNRKQINKAKLHQHFLSGEVLFFDHGAYDGPLVLAKIRVAWEKQKAVIEITNGQIVEIDGQVKHQILDVLANTRIFQLHSGNHFIGDDIHQL